MNDPTRGVAPAPAQGAAVPAPLLTPARRVREGVWVVLLAVLAKLAGIAREVALAALFGTSAAADALRVSLNGFDLPAHVLADAPLENAAVPALRALRSRGERHAAAATVSWLLLLLTGAGVVLSLLLFIGAPRLVGLLAPGFDAQRARSATLILRWLAAAYPLLLAGRVLMAAAFAEDRFRLPAIRPLLLNLAILAGTVLAAASRDLRWFAWIPGIAWAVHLVWLARGARGTWSWQPDWTAARPALRSLRRTFPLSIAVCLLDLSFVLVNQRVASWLAPGSVAALEYARFIAETPVATVGLGLTQVSLPLLAEWAALGRDRELNAGSERIIATALLLLLPVSLLLLLGASPIVALLYGRGAFGASSQVETARALTGFAAGAWAWFIAYFLYRVYFARGSFARLAAWVAAAAAVNAVLAVVLARQWGLIGITSATSVSRVVLLVLCATILAPVVRRRLAMAAAYLLAGAALIGVAGWVTLARLGSLPQAGSAAALHAHPAGSIVSLVLLGLAIAVLWLAWSWLHPYWRSTWRQLLPTRGRGNHD